jgi:hypothetical protein
MPGTFPLFVEVLSIPHMGDTKGFGECIFSPRNGDEMHVVIHQAIRQQREMIFRRVDIDPRELLKAVFIILEDSLPSTSSLSDMIWMIGDDDPRQSRPERFYCRSIRLSR